MEKLTVLTTLGPKSMWGVLFKWRTLVTHVDIVAQALEGEGRGLASHIPIGDVRLYAEYPLVHVRM